MRKIEEKKNHPIHSHRRKKDAEISRFLTDGNHFSSS